jgi:hypothetical protein
VAGRRSTALPDGNRAASQRHGTHGDNSNSQHHHYGIITSARTATSANHDCITTATCAPPTPIQHLFPDPHAVHIQYQCLRTPQCTYSSLSSLCFTPSAGANASNPLAGGLHAPGHAADVLGLGLPARYGTGCRSTVMRHHQHCWVPMPFEGRGGRPLFSADARARLFAPAPAPPPPKYSFRQVRLCQRRSRIGRNGRESKQLPICTLDNYFTDGHITFRSIHYKTGQINVELPPVMGIL